MYFFAVAEAVSHPKIWKYVGLFIGRHDLKWRDTTEVYSPICNNAKHPSTKGLPNEDLSDPKCQ